MKFQKSLLRRNFDDTIAETEPFRLMSKSDKRKTKNDKVSPEKR